jgi:superfamily II DNA or RNA helicase
VELRPYQQEALASMLEAESNGINKQLIVLPTGAGKTVLFAQLPIIRKESLPMLVLAHRSELLIQAKDKIETINKDLSVGIEQADNKAGYVDVVIASVPTLGRESSSRIEKYPKNYFKTIVVDEAHHSAAPSYRRILDYFTPELLLGVTATPQRSDSVRLIDVFQEIVYYKSIQDLIKEGWLSPLVGYRVKTSTDISDVEIQNGEYKQDQLIEAIDNPGRNNSIVTAYNDLANAKKTVVFAAGVDHAGHLEEAFRKNGSSVRVIIGTTPEEERRQILSDFKSGAVTVLVNVGVLTEGFDEPSIEAIILAKPTRSSLLYTQIVGRGTRLFEGKEHCMIIDIADTTRGKKPIGLPTLLGMPAEFDLQGQSLTDIADEFEKLKETAPGEASSVLNMEDITNAYKRIDLFMPPPPNPAVLEYSTFIWSEVGEDRFYLNTNSFESFHIYCDTLGRWTAECHIRSGANVNIHVIGRGQSIRSVFAGADKWIMENRSTSLPLIDATAVWRADAPTDKQQKLLKRIGVPITNTMTKGMASQIISKWMEKPENKRPAWLENKIKQNKRW